MFSLSGKCALVTGASGGIGGAIAEALVAAGAKVALSGTRVEPLEALKAKLGASAFVCPGDLGDAAATEKLFKDAEAALGQVDILVNNAGLTRDGLAMRMKDEDWQKVIDVNLSAGFRLSRAALRGMMKRKWGRIVGITSIVGVTGNPGHFIVSPMTDALNDEQKTRLLGGIPLGRMGTAAEIAASVVYLASDEAAYVTGQTLHVNGGMAMI